MKAPLFCEVGDIRSRDHIGVTGYPAEQHPHFCDCDDCLNRGGGVRVAAVPAVISTLDDGPPAWRKRSAAGSAVAEMRAENRRIRAARRAS